MRRTASLWMALLLVWSLMLPAAAETAAAATLRLEKAEGTVTVSTAAGRTVSTTDGMRLYSGYVLETGTDSYAYVSLDSTKAVKLDASSRGEVSKSGKKLELKAVSGKLFFNVTAPVKEDESLNIRTSTMVTGVRGTAGWVEVVDRSVSRVHLLEGTLTVTAAEPSTGELRRTVITGGQTVTAAVNGASRPGQQTSLTVAELREEDVPAFVAVELAKDPALQDKVEKNSPLSVEEIIRGAEDRLREEQAAADAAERALRDQLGGGSGADQVFPDSRDDADSDDRDSGGSSDTPVTPPAPEPPVTETVRTLDDPTAAELTAALNESGVTRVYVTNAGKSDRSDLHTGTYHVGGDQTLTIQSGTLTVGGGKTLTVEGTMVNAGGLSIIGTMDVNGSFTNDTNGQVLVTSEMSLHVNQGGTMVNRGTVTVAGGNSALLEISGELYNEGAVALGNDDGSGTLRVTDTGTLTNTSTGTITVREKSIVHNMGRFENSGRFSDSADSNALTGGFTSAGTYTDIRTDTVYAIAKEQGGAVRYLGPLTSMPGWYEKTAVTLMGGKSVAWNGRTEEHQVAVPGVTLDLNGRTVELVGNVALTVAADGELTVKDGDSAGGGALTTDGESTLQVSGGTLTLESGSIRNTHGGDGNSGGTAITTSYTSGGTVNIHGGTVRSENDFGVQINGAGTLKITGGSVVSGSGTAVALRNDNMEKSAEITGGSVLSERGTAVLVSGGALRVTGGSITGWTGGIFNQTKDSKNVTISGGVITLSAAKPGQGQYAVNNCTIRGGTLRAKNEDCIVGDNVGGAELRPIEGTDAEGYYVRTAGDPGTP